MQDMGAAVQGSRSMKRVLRLLPDLECKPDDISISSSGSFAAICGTHRNVSASFCKGSTANRVSCANASLKILRYSASRTCVQKAPFRDGEGE